jgi:hypothetical protein
MRTRNILLALGVGLGAAFAVACGSSSSTAPSPGPGPGPDASAASSGDDGSTPASCLPVTPSGFCPTGQGLTCCLDFSAGFSGSCVKPSACSTTVQVACNSVTQCGTNQVCCADFGGDGGTLAAFQDGGLSALKIDAAALSTDAGVSAIASMLDNLNFNVACQTSCTGSQIQACATDMECGGGSCVPLSTLLADAGGDAGIPSSLATVAGELGMEMVCVPKSADAGVVVDAGVPSDAAADAPVDAP